GIAEQLSHRGSGRLPEANGPEAMTFRYCLKRGKTGSAHDGYAPKAEEVAPNRVRRSLAGCNRTISDFSCPGCDALVPSTSRTGKMLDRMACDVFELMLRVCQ